MACGGAESCICELGIGGFASMKALSDSDDPARASIPFDKERSGFVMGEGSGILILEEYEHAVKRGAKILGEIAGYGASCDANHMTAPLEDGSGAADCMTLAIRDAGIEPCEVGYINAHGTGTPLNDKGETKAVKLAFGEHGKECDLKICPNEGVAFDSEYAMSNSLGFGGHNASLIFKRV